MAGFCCGRAKLTGTRQGPRLVAFEHSKLQANNPDNILLLVGGLGDGLLTSSFFTDLASPLPPNWSLVQVLLSSSYTGWTTGSVGKDATELATCVSYFRKLKPTAKIAMMGHSTGCQDVMEYLTGSDHESRPSIDGAILQAPISDREGMLMFLPEGAYEKSISAAQQMVDAGQGDDILPSPEAASIFGAPVCARRWLSLASPGHDGEDDYFSSDLTDEQLSRSFGSLPARTPVCILYMGSDEYVPPSIDKQALVDRWIKSAESGGAIIDKGNSGVVEGGTHDMKGVPSEVWLDFVAKVVGFLTSS